MLVIVRRTNLALWAGVESYAGWVCCPPLSRTFCEVKLKHQRSPERRDRQLLADLAGQAIVDLGVTWNRGFRAFGRIDIDRVTAPFAIQPTPLLLQVPDQFVPLQG